MNNKEHRIYLQTKLRNLKRKYSKLIQHEELAEEAIDIKADIDQLERELNSQ